MAQLWQRHDELEGLYALLTRGCIKESSKWKRLGGTKGWFPALKSSTSLESPPAPRPPQSWGIMDVSTYIADNRELADSRENVKPNPCKTKGERLAHSRPQPSDDNSVAQGDALQA